MKKLSTKWFRKWAKNANLSNQTLVKAIKNLETGLSAPGLGKDLLELSSDQLKKYVVQEILFDLEVEK